MKNTRDRARQRQSDPMFEFDTVNGQMIWALWRQIRRSNERRRRRAAAAAGTNVSYNYISRTLRQNRFLISCLLQDGAAAAGNADSPENWSDSDDSSDENSGDDDDGDGDNPPGGIGCQTS